MTAKLQEIALMVGCTVCAATQPYPVQIESVEGSTIHATIPELGWMEIQLTEHEIILDDEVDTFAETGADEFPDNILQFADWDPTHCDWDDTEVA